MRRSLRWFVVAAVMVAGPAPSAHGSAPDTSAHPWKGPTPSSASPLGGTTSSARAAFWVAPYGNDSGPGTRSAPFATLDRARDAVRDLERSWRLRHSIVVNLEGGTYRLRDPFILRPRDSGLRGHDVVYRAAPGASPVISGAKPVPPQDWDLVDPGLGIYRAHVGQVASRQLYVNGVRATVAQTEPFPAGFAPQWDDGGPDSGIAYIPTIQPGGLNPSTWGDPSAWTNVSEISAVVQTQWKMMSVPLRSVTPPSGGPGSQGLLTLQQPGWDNANVFIDSETGQPGIWSFWQVTRFENAYEFLDSPGEWYLDRGAGDLFYIPRIGENLATADVELAVREVLVDGRGRAGRPVSDIRFQGLTFSYATWLDPSGPSGYVSDQGGFHLMGSNHEPNVIGHDRDVVATPANVRFRSARRVTFRGNTFEHLGAAGLSLGTGSRHNVIDRNLFTDISSTAIQVGGIDELDHHPRRADQITRGNRLSNNLVRSVAVEYVDAPGIYAGFTRRTIIDHNTIVDVPWSAIAMGWGWGLLDPGGFPGLPGARRNGWGRHPSPTPNGGSVISGNRISDFLGELWDGGAIYTTGSQGPSPADGLLIEENVISHKRSSAGGNTFYTDGGSRHITVRRNIAFDAPVGTTDFGPAPRPGDPLPYPDGPSEGNGVPYGSDLGGCRTYGDIRYIGNHWLQDPFSADVGLYNDLYELLLHFQAYSSDGFFNICPFTDRTGVAYPTHLTFRDNHALAAGVFPRLQRIVANAGVQEG